MFLCFLPRFFGKAYVYLFVIPQRARSSSSAFSLASSNEACLLFRPLIMRAPPPLSVSLQGIGVPPLLPSAGARLCSSALGHAKRCERIVENAYCSVTTRRNDMIVIVLLHKNLRNSYKPAELRCCPSGLTCSASYIEQEQIIWNGFFRVSLLSLHTLFVVPRVSFSDDVGRRDTTCTSLVRDLIIFVFWVIICTRS